MYNDFQITQKEKTLSLSGSNKIVINKYENKISRLLFTFDGTIKGRLYVALLNPVTNKYSITPILNDKVIITTDITVYPGRWDMILIGVQDDYEITNNDIDQSKLTYVSDTFKRIIIRDNFLGEENIERINNPAIDEALESLRIAQDRLEEAAIKAAESVDSSSANKDICNDILSQINIIQSDISAIYQEILSCQIKTSEDAESVSNDKVSVQDLHTHILELSSNIGNIYADIHNIESNINETKSEIDSSEERLNQLSDRMSEEALDYILQAKRWAIGDEAIPESTQDNAKYYARQSQAAVASLLPKVEDAKSHIDNYVTQKEAELKGDTGNVYFASFKVINGRLKLYSDPSFDKVTFKRVGSRLKYKLTI